ncbi:unnamed protein product [Didymodactylos carnosus]|uniref:Uncharacterized protein n=1 Tax=Didymodactylos carnosus TaxID=1234261 RepID=A0A814NX16_9BILA|nr:unnamed protein product [Didymodactylos carnosus]CAF3864285.1 unnamed protein product [Didymodactylos carnosus]
MDKQWINKYLSIIKLFIITIRFDHKQLDELFSLYPTITSICDTYPQLASIIWLDVSKNQNEEEKYAHYLNVFKQTCIPLTLDCNKHWNDQELINQIFIDITFDLHPNYSLKRLTLSLSCLYHLFLLVEYLPQLEYLKIQINICYKQLSEFDSEINWEDSGVSGKDDDYNYDKITDKLLSLYLKEFHLEGRFLKIIT